jgi:tetratricopeptide (TPR) repeat protein
MTRLLLWILVVGLSCNAAAQDNLLKAKAALANRDTATALSALRDALKNGQRPGEVNYLLGAIAYHRGKMDEAIPYLEVAVKYDDENAEALSMLGLGLMGKKDLQGALTNLRRAEKFGKKNPQVLTTLGKALLMVDSADAAIQKLTLAKEYDPNNPVIYNLLGDAFLKQGVPPLAVTNYQKAIELQPNDIATRMKLGKVFEDQRNYTEAVKAYDGILGVDSVNTTALLAKGKILVRAKLFPRAVAPLAKLTNLHPKSVEGSQLYAKALSGANSFADAAKEAERSLKLDSSSVDIWRILAESLVETKEFAGALKAYDGLRRRKALGNEDYAKYGNALVGVGREDEALKALLTAVEADSTNCDPYYNLGSLYMKKQDWVRAAVMFEKKIGCDPRSLGAYLNASACYMQPALKNYVRTRELLMKALELKPDFLLGRIWLARYYSQVDSLDNAKEQYDEVLKEIGSNTEKYRREAGEAYYLTGSYYFTLKQYDRAVDSFRKAFGVQYDNAALQLLWGQAVLQTLDPKQEQAENKKKIEDAIAHFRKASAMDPNSSAAHLWLGQGLVLARVEGDNDGNRKLVEEACSEYRKVLRIDPSNPDAKKAMERIGCPGAGK